MVKPSSVLITGGSGYFGRAFAQHALDQDCERVCIFSRGEARQAAMRAEMTDSRLRWFIGDVRDLGRLRQAMEGVQLVVHAAALKRIEVCEYDVSEVVKTNVGGTLNVVDAALSVNAQYGFVKPLRVIGISSDKAAAPINAYGATKLVMEKILLAANNYAGPRFAVVRYGNVFASTGSVVPTWRDMVSRGAAEVPVTSPFATRFFMTREQAVELVWQTALTMGGGEMIVPNLPAYELSDLAEAMGVRMRVVGLSPFEKLHETMGGEDSSKARRMGVGELREALHDL